MELRATSTLIALLLVGATALAQIPAGGVVTTGEAPTRPCGVTAACTSGLQVRSSMQLCGTIVAPDGSEWELPAPITDGPAAVDIYNDCTGQGDNPNYLEQVKNGGDRPRWRGDYRVHLRPLGDPSCVKDDNGRDSTGCPFEKTPSGNKVPCGLADPTTCKALLFKIPDDWTATEFDDSSWPRATLYTADQVTGTPGYVRHADLFEPAQFIWTRNLVLDNLVLARYTVKAPPQ